MKIIKFWFVILIGISSYYCCQSDNTKFNLFNSFFRDNISTFEELKIMVLDSDFHFNRVYLSKDNTEFSGKDTSAILVHGQQKPNNYSKLFIIDSLMKKAKISTIIIEKKKSLILAFGYIGISDNCFNVKFNCLDDTAKLNEFYKRKYFNLGNGWLYQRVSCVP